MTKSVFRSFSFYLACCLAFSGYTTDAGELPQVPEGFTIEVVAEAPLVTYPMMAGFDDRGRLFIAESAGSNNKAADLLKDPPSFIRMLEDTDGDGKFDNSTIFADKMTLPMGALWYRGALYVASPPHIWRLEDTDNDGVADQREKIVSEFGFSGNAASIHGCFLGPDGRLYWCDGRHGHEFKDANGNVTSKGLAARIFSCKPDGSDVQIFCGGGMDNPVEIDFMPTGEMLGTVNILLHGPRVDCLMHWVEGGLYPHHARAINEFPRTGELLQPMTRFGHVAVSGMTRYRSEQFGDQYKNNIFTTIFNLGKVARSQIKRIGSTFKTTEEDFLTSNDPNFHPTDILEDADGSLLVINTGGWFRLGCPTSQIAKPEFTGAIYRIRKTGTPAVKDPRGLTLNWNKLTPDQLTELLSDPRPVVQQKAIEQLALMGEPALGALEKVLVSNNSAATLNAIWTLRRMENDKATVLLKSGLKQTDPDIVIASLKSLSGLYDLNSLEEILALVNSDNLTLSRTAATAVGAIAEYHLESLSAEQVEKIVAVLFQQLGHPQIDRLTEHSLLYALIRMNQADAVQPYLKEESPVLRRAALLALDQMSTDSLTKEQVLPLLNTSDPGLQQETLTVISSREGWASATLDLIRDWFQQPELTEEQTGVLRSFLIAQTKDQQVQNLIAEAFPKVSIKTRILLLDVITRSQLSTLPPVWAEVLKQNLNESETDTALPALRAIEAFALKQFDDQLQELISNETLPASLRVEATRVLAPRLESTSDKLFAYILSQLNEEISPLDRLSAARTLATLPLTESQFLVLCDTLEEAGPVARPVLVRSFSRTQSEEVGTRLITVLANHSSSLAPEQVSVLFRKYSPAIQQQAEQKLISTDSHLAEQKALLEKLEPLTTGGEAGKGEEVFFGKKAACSGCHAVSGKGARIGPDLTQIGAIRTGKDLLEAIVLPSASFAREFNSYLILTEDGLSHSGIISRETPEAVYLRKSDLSEVRIPQNEIEEMQESKISIMPKDLDKAISPEEMRDLIAYLKSLKKL